MQIAGLQKVTLLDYPGMVACTVFTRGCGFHCPFCHNASLLASGPAAVTWEEVLSYIRMRSGVLDGVVISGGEPTLQTDLEAFLKEIHGLGLRIKLDTNGSRPEVLSQLVDAGLIDYVAMDIKNAPELYPVTAGCTEADLRAVEESKAYLLSGRVPYEFRTTVVKGLHTKESLLSAAHFIAGAERYFLQTYRDRGDILRPEGLSAYTDAEMKTLLACVQTVIGTAELRGVA